MTLFRITMGRMNKDNIGGVEAACTALKSDIPDTVITRATARLSGTVRVPASKSYTHRAIMVGAMGQDCRIVNPLLCDDTAATVRVLGSLGVSVEMSADGALKVSGTDGRIEPASEEVNAGESGTLLRMVLPGLAQCTGRLTVTGEGSLMSRPNGIVVEPLRKLGVSITGTGAEYRLPITIEGKGSVDCGDITLDAGSSSQAVSAFLFWSPLFRQACGRSITRIAVAGPVVSAPYIEITLDMLERAGISVECSGLNDFAVPAGQKFRTEGKTLVVGGDYSSAAFLMAAAALTGPEVTLLGMLDDRQGDRAVIEILKMMGADLICDDDSITVRGPADLRGIDIDCGSNPDLVPVLTALACFASGPSAFRNIGHLKIKESNRIAAPAEELRKLGARIDVTDDQIRVKPARLRPAAVAAHNDHRLAMALAVAGLRLPGLTISGMKSISKSYPLFLDDMRSLGADIAFTG